MIHLETAHLIFRDHLPSDLEAYVEIESDALYRAPQKVHPKTELERSFRESVFPPKVMGLLATIFKPDGNYIGRCGLYPARNSSDEVVAGKGTLAFYLARPYWGRGLATEAGIAFIKYGFESLDLDRIVAGAAVENLASNRVLQKIGLHFTHSGGGDDGGSRWNAYELINPARNI